MRETGSEDIKRKYKKQNNKVREASREFEKRVQREISEQSKQNPKKIWKYVKSKTSTISKVADLETADPSGGRRVTSRDEEKAEILAEQFSKVFVNETTDAPQMERKQC